MAFRLSRDFSARIAVFGIGGLAGIASAIPPLFAPNVNYLLGSGPTGIAVGDFNSDGVGGTTDLVFFLGRFGGPCQ